MNGIFSNENPVFASFAAHGAVLFLKMMFVVFSTVFYRTTKEVQINPEDVKLFDPTGKKELKPILHDPDVERVRRCHQNDMENIFPFLIVGFFYITTNPVPSTAMLLFRVFTVARILHTIVYMGAVRQPARALCFMVNAIINMYMAVSVILHYM